MAQTIWSKEEMIASAKVHQNDCNFKLDEKEFNLSRHFQRIFDGVIFFTSFGAKLNLSPCSYQVLYIDFVICFVPTKASFRCVGTGDFSPTNMYLTI